MTKEDAKPVKGTGLSPMKVDVAAPQNVRVWASYSVPMPTLWRVWNSLPSVLMLGAMMISVS